MNFVDVKFLEFQGDVISGCHCDSPYALTGRVVTVREHRTGNDTHITLQVSTTTWKICLNGLHEVSHDVRLFKRKH